MSQCFVEHQRISDTGTHTNALVLSVSKPTFATKLFVDKVKIIDNACIARTILLLLPGCDFLSLTLKI